MDNWSNFNDIRFKCGGLRIFEYYFRKDMESIKYIEMTTDSVASASQIEDT